VQVPFVSPLVPSSRNLGFILSQFSYSAASIFQELVARLQQPQNLISYHLRTLATHQLVSERRSAADGRDIYYSLNLDLLRDRYAAAAIALHPALGGFASAHQETLSPQISQPYRVLFLCTENSARSQMAEGLLRSLAGDALDVCSAGSQPSEVHPFAMQVLAQIGIDSSQQRSKHLDCFRNQSFDAIITVCDRMRECCPTFLGDSEQIHWSLPDPVALEGISEQERYEAFEHIAQQLLTRLSHFLLLLAYEQGQHARTV
jgi:ArsR family transcriptional regulator, arsenate/arsenite/antimonite-responsive transcriptional repressor / arsenate reductase (thioredoxin)